MASGTGARYTVSAVFDPAGIQQGTAAAASAFASMAQAGVQANQLILQSTQAVGAQLATQAASIQSLASITAELASQASGLAGVLATEATVSLDAASGIEALAVGQTDATASAIDLSSALAATAATATESTSASLDSAAALETLAAGQASVAAGGAELAVVHQDLAAAQVAGVDSAETLAAANESLAASAASSAAAIGEGLAETEGAAAGNVALTDSAQALAASQGAVAAAAAGTVEVLGSVAGVTGTAAAGQESLASSSEAVAVAQESLAASASAVLASTEGIAATSESATAALETRASAAEAASVSQEALASGSAVLAAGQGAVAASADAAAVASERAASGASALASIQEGLASVSGEAAAVQQALSTSETESAGAMGAAAAGAAALVASTGEVLAAQQAAAVVAAESAAAEVELASARAAEAAAAAAAAAVAAAAAEAEAERLASVTALQGKLEQLVLTVDAEAAAEAKLTAAELLLDEALQAGLITLERQNELLDLAKDKFAVAGEGAEAAGAKVGEMAEMVKGLLEVLFVFEAIDFFKESVSSAAKFQVSLAQINASLASTHDASGMTSQGLVEIAEHLEETTNYSHTAALGMENLLLNFKSIRGDDTFKRVSQDVADLAAKMGTDLPQAAVQLGRVIETGTVTSLKRIGVVFSDTEQAGIKSMHAMGNEAGVLSIVLKGVESAVGGQAAAVRDASSGTEAFKNTLEATQETIGSGMLPAVREITGEMQAWLKSDQAAAADLGANLGSVVKVAGEGVLFLANNFGTLRTAAELFVAYKIGTTLYGIGTAAVEAAKGVAALDLALDANAIGVALAVIAGGILIYREATSAKRDLADAETAVAAASQKRVEQGPGESKLLDTLKTQTTKLTEAQDQLLEGYRKVTAAAQAANDQYAAMLVHQIDDLQHKYQNMAGPQGYGRDSGAIRPSPMSPDQLKTLDDLEAKLKAAQEADAGFVTTLAAEDGALNRLGVAHEATATGTGAATKAQVAFTDSIEKQILSLSDKAAKLKVEAAAELEGAGAAALHAGATAAEAMVDKDLLEAKQKGLSVSPVLIAALRAEGAEIDRNTALKLQNALAFKDAEADVAAEAANRSRLADAINQNSVASTLSTAVDKADQENAKAGIPIWSLDALERDAHAASVARDKLASEGHVVAIKSDQAAMLELRAAMANLADAQTRSTVASSELAISEKAEATARSENLVAGSAEYNQEVQRLTQLQLTIQRINAVTAAQKELGATYDEGAKLTAQASDMQQLSAATSEYGDNVAKVMQQYGLLDTASHQLQLDEKIRTAQANVSSELDRQNIAAQITLEDQYLQGLRAQQAVVAANIAVQKDWQATVTATDQQFQTQLNTLIETGKVNWSTFVKNLEDIWLKGLEQMAIDGRAADLVSSLTSGTISAGNAAGSLLTGQQSALQNAAVQLQTAAKSLMTASDSVTTQFQPVTDALTTAGTDLSAAGADLSAAAEAIISGSTDSSASIDAAATSSASTDTAAASDQTSLFSTMTTSVNATFQQMAGTMDSSFAQVTGELQVCATDLNTAAIDLNTAAGDLAASAQSSGGGGFGGLLGQLFGGGGGGGAATGSGAWPAASEFEDASFTGSSNIDLTGAGSAAGSSWASGFASAALPILGAIALFTIADWASKTKTIHDYEFAQYSVGTPSQVSNAGVLQNTGANIGWQPAGSGFDIGNVNLDQITKAFQTFVQQLQTTTSSLVTFLPQIGVKVMQQGKQFEAVFEGVATGLYNDEQSAISAALIQGIHAAKFAGLSKVMQDYIESATAHVSADPTTQLTQVQTDLSTLAAISDQAGGAVSQVVTTMRGFFSTAQGYDQALMQMNLSTADLTTELGMVNSGLIANLTQERDNIVGITLTAKQKQALDVQSYNAQLAMEENQLKMDVVQLQQEALGLAGQGAYINGLGLVARATVDSATVQAKSAAVINSANQTQIDNINALIQSDNDLIKELEGLQIKPGDIKGPEGGASSATSSAATSLATAANDLEQAANALKIQGADQFVQSLAAITVKYDDAERGLKKESAAYKDLEQARADEIKLLKEQTLATIGTDITPYVQAAHGLTAYQVQLAGLDSTFQGYYKTAQEAGAGGALLNRILLAQGEAEKQLGQQAIASLNLPIESMTATLTTAANTISFLEQNFKTLGLTMTQVSQIVVEEGQQLSLSIAQGMQQYVTNAADKQAIDELAYQLQKAQWETEIQMAYAMNLITQAEYTELQKIWNDLPNTLPASTASAASANSSLASSATSAADALKAFAESLTQNTQLSALTPSERLAQAQAYYQATTAAAETGDQTALGNEQTAAQDYLTALRSMYGSAGPYEPIFNAVIATLNQLGTRFGTAGPGTGVVPSGPGSQPAPTTQEAWVRFATGMEYEMPVGTTLPPGAVWISGPGGQASGAGPGAVNPTGAGQGAAAVAPDTAASAHDAAVGLTATATAAQSAATALVTLTQAAVGGATSGDTSAATMRTAAVTMSAAVASFVASPPVAFSGRSGFTPSDIYDPIVNQLKQVGAPIVEQLQIMMARTIADGAALRAQVQTLAGWQAAINQTLLLNQRQQPVAGRAV